MVILIIIIHLLYVYPITTISRIILRLRWSANAANQMFVFDY